MLVTDFLLFYVFVTSVCVVDVIGLVTAMSEEREYVKDGNITRMVVFEITDHRC